MIDNFNILLPEIFLTLSILTVLMIGVFTKNSFNLVSKLSLIIISLLILILIFIIKILFISKYPNKC